MIEAKSLGLQEASQIVEAVLKAAAETEPPDRPMSVAVVDASGDLVCFARMDGASALTVHMAINKAYTAARWKMDGTRIQNMIKDGRDITWFGDPRYAPIGGGILVKASDGSIVGAVGTSGRVAMAPMGDEELARIGAKAVSL